MQQFLEKKTHPHQISFSCDLYFSNEPEYKINMNQSQNHSGIPW